MVSSTFFVAVIVAHLAATSAYPALEVTLNDEDVTRDTMQLIESRGYFGESHRVLTDDGYILTVFRFRNYCAMKQRPRPIVLHHGLLDTSRSWLVATPGGHAMEANTANDSNIGSTLGFELGKRCFDVWLPNSRGNRYSQEHIKYTNKSYEFWEFTYDEMIQYDLPVVIDYVLEMTGHKKLDYIGHSQGTLIMFGLLSTRPEYQAKVNKFLALAPVARCNHIHTSFRHLSKVYFLFSWLNKVKGPFLLSTSTKRYITRFICNSPVRTLCSNLLFAISGFSPDNLNVSRMGVYSHEYPGGTSMKNMVHWLQGVRSGEFKKFDYGSTKNVQVYGRPTPPPYQLGRINDTKIYLFSAVNDWLAPPEDVDFIRETIGTKLELDYVVPDAQFNHNDFLFSINAGKLVNRKVYEVLKDQY